MIEINGKMVITDTGVVFVPAPGEELNCVYLFESMLKCDVYIHLMEVGVNRSHLCFPYVRRLHEQRTLSDPG